VAPNTSPPNVLALPSRVQSREMQRDVLACHGYVREGRYFDLSQPCLRSEIHDALKGGLPTHNQSINPSIHRRPEGYLPLLPPPPSLLTKLQNSITKPSRSVERKGHGRNRVAFQTPHLPRPQRSQGRRALRPLATASSRLAELVACAREPKGWRGSETGSRGYAGEVVVCCALYS
jgi:hypothetical protein